MTEKNWHSFQIIEILNQLKTNQENGLTEKEAKDRLFFFGENKLPKSKRKSFIQIFFKQFLSPLTALLIFAALLAYFLGDLRDSLVILAVMAINSLIGTFHESRAEESIEALQNITPLQCVVLRSGLEMKIDTVSIVPGDILKISAGDAIVADARALLTQSLFVNESTLTGESLPVEKIVGITDVATHLSDRTNMLFAGSFVTAGRALAVVVATGPQTEIGKIAKLASSAKRPKTKLEQQIEKFGKRLIVFSAGLFCFTLVTGLLKGFGFLEIVMIAIGQMVSIVPEGLPVALTIALAVGVQRLARRGAIVRDLSSVENLGAITIICFDKTGTLTKNEMTVTHAYLPNVSSEFKVTGHGYDPKGDIFYQGLPIQARDYDGLVKLGEACVLCNDAQLCPPHDNHPRWHVLGDPTEGALLTFAVKCGIDWLHIKRRSSRLLEIPFNSNDKMMATLHDYFGVKKVFLKGAPEKVFELCSLSLEDHIKYEEIVKSLGNSSLRILAFATADMDFLGEFNDLKGKLHFLGIIAQTDPARPMIQESLNECLSAGIKTLMITGDHKRTGVAMARSLGLLTQEGHALDGSELDQMSDDVLKQRINEIRLFSRVRPDQKLRIIESLQSRGEVVAMTGDGVNDAPALMRANIGIAMGFGGTDVAREASKLILTDDNFSTIVSAISEGRLVYQNIKKLILFLFVTSLDEVLILTLALSFGYPFPLTAVQILWINLVTEGTLTLNLVMDPLEGNEMQRKPVPFNEALLDRKLLRRVPFMVIPSVLVTFIWFTLRVDQKIAIDMVRTETFTLLVFCQWFNVLNCRSDVNSVFKTYSLKNLWLLAGLLISLILQLLVIYWKPLAEFFHTISLSLEVLIQLATLSSSVLIVEEVRKFFSRRANGNYI
jgi:Ca2+-transporting ATPase